MPNIEPTAYAGRLSSRKSSFPVSKWRIAGKRGWELYSEANCDQAEGILNQLVDGLIDAGEAASEETKIAVFKSAIEALNALDNDTGMIETGEREDLCKLLDQVAADCGIDPGKYGNGEGIATEWRDW